MITTDSPTSSGQTVLWTLAVVALLGLGLAAWWLFSSGGLLAEREQATDPAVVVGTSVSDVAAASLLPDGRPSDFSPDEWAVLKEVMAKTANPQVELQRVVGYLRFQKGFAQWQSLRDSGSVARREQLAATLVDQLPERLRQGEVTMDEALLLSAALWTDLEPNEGRRKVRLDEVHAILARTVPPPDAEQPAREAAQQAEYKRREAAIVLEYQARPDSQKDQAWLELQLETARRAVYGAN